MNWNYPDYSILVPYYDGALVANINQIDQLPINIPPYESRTVYLLFPYAGNNYVDGDITEMNAETGEPPSRPFTIQILYSKQFLFWRKRKTVSGDAYLGKRYANSITNIYDTNKQLSNNDYIELSIKVSLLGNDYNETIRCNKNVTISDIETHYESFLLSIGESPNEYFSHAYIKKGDEEIHIDPSATIDEITKGNHLVLGSFDLQIVYGGIGNSNNTEGYFRAMIKRIQGVNPLIPTIMISTNYGKSFVGLRISREVTQIIPANKYMEYEWSTLSTEDKNYIKSMISNHSKELSKFYREYVIQKRIPEPIEIVFKNRQYILTSYGLLDNNNHYDSIDSYINGVG